jgi:hypothetical protein
MESDYPRIFSKTFRASPTASQPQKGTGAQEAWFIG